MEVYVLIDKEGEKVIIHCRERNELVNKIEEMVLNNDKKIDCINCYGYLEKDIILLNINDITRFFVEEDKTFASIDNKKYQVKKRLYQVEGILNDDFIKINKSCIINMKHIKRFNTSWSGTLLVELDNGEKEYVSRRLIKNLKERMGI